MAMDQRPAQLAGGVEGKGQPWHSRPAVRFAFASLAVAVAYFAGGKVGLLLAGSNPSVSAVWPPSGIAIAALLLGGSELWPAVFVGAFFVNLTTTWDVASTLGIASGNTLEALIGSYLATRFASGKRLVDRPTSVFTFAVLSGMLSTTVAATIGSTSLTLAHLSSWSDFAAVWTPWWLGDAIGVIEVTPLVLVLFQRASEEHRLLPLPGPGEAVAVGSGVVAVALFVFTEHSISLLGSSPLIFLVILPCVWAALRFGPLGAVGSVSAVSVIAIVATVTGHGPFALLPSAISLLVLRLFIGSVALTALLVAADSTQHHLLEQELDRTRKELQRALSARTAELDAARSLAKVGTWSYQVASQKMIWSDEMYRIFGYGEERFPVELDRLLAPMPVEDRARFQSEMTRTLDSSDPAASAGVEEQIALELEDGEQRTIVSKLQVAEWENGRATRLTGTILDITERARIEAELRRLKSIQEGELRKPENLRIWMMPWFTRRQP